LSKDKRKKSKEKSLRKNKKGKSALINRNKINMSLYNGEAKKNKLKKGSININHFKKKMKEEIDLVIDFNFDHLILFFLFHHHLYLLNDQS